MGIELKIFSLYKSIKSEKYYLLRTTKPSYSNSSETENDLANQIEQQNRIYTLSQISLNYEHVQNADFEFIGELQESPIGDNLYKKFGKNELPIFYMTTEYGEKWIILGNADSETEFLEELKDNDDLLSLKPIGTPQKIIVTFITENDLDNLR